MFKRVAKHSKEVFSAVAIGVLIAIISAVILEYIYSVKAPNETVLFSEGIHANSKVPQLWSDHKLLNIPSNKCASNGQLILKGLGFNSVIQNNQYIYGNFDGNRAVIKCVDLAEKSFVYIAVAGSNVKQVEKLRNEISWKL
ncbi:hypothetical protein [Flocculibacter collagenilyticus]|uniref:hypothetical protein n=1 Tax=Flocculibacter collagenilyticus TaxID=2744479 RepID=UPI0018F6A3DB|nr:hypothetical protein [Flocculibacter collagenilyticus]